MTTPTILSSPFLTIQVIDGLLSSSSTQEITQEEKVRLLSAKVHLLFQRGSSFNSNSNSNTDTYREEEELSVLNIRLDLSRAYLDLVPPDVKGAESELGLIDGSCKGMIKRLGKTNPAQESYTIRLLSDLKALRIRASHEMIRVEDLLGRESRAERWRKAIQLMEEEKN